MMLRTDYLKFALVALFVVGCGSKLSVVTPNGGGTNSAGGNVEGAAAPSIALYTDRSIINFDQPVNLSWNAFGSSFCSLTDGKGNTLSRDVQGSVIQNMKYPVSGGYQITYQLNCTVQGQSLQSSRTVTVNDVTDHLVFVTSALHAGNLGGLTGADQICTSAAAARNLRPGKTWKAILTGGGKAIGTRMTLQFRVRNMMGETIFANASDFYVRGTNPLKAIQYTELGTARAATVVDVWTGTSDDGSNQHDCSSWTTSSGGSNVGMSAISTSNTVTWTNSNNDETCDKTRALYCISL